MSEPTTRLFLALVGVEDDSLTGGANIAGIKGENLHYRTHHANSCNVSCGQSRFFLCGDAKSSESAGKTSVTESNTRTVSTRLGGKDDYLTSALDAVCLYHEYAWTHQQVYQQAH